MANLTVSVWSKLYSLEFRTLPKIKSLHLLFWEGQSLVDVEVARVPRDIPIMKRELTLIPQLQSAISVKGQIISCGGCSADVLKALDQEPVRQGAFSARLGRNLWTSKNLRVGLVTMLCVVSMSFHFFRPQLVRLTGALVEKWMHATTHLRQVGH